MPWETEALSYNTLHPRLVLVRDAVTRLSPAKVLELGCSVGKLREELITYGLDYWGCDLSNSAVALIDDPHVIVCDLNREPLPFTEAFDCVVASGLLEYIDDIPSLLENIRQRVPVNGYLVLTYLNMTHVLKRLAKAVGRQQPRHPDWRTSFSPSQMLRMIENAGFEVFRQEPVSLLLRKTHRPRGIPGLDRVLRGEVVFVARAVSGQASA